jgi:outer membrane protein insertion porin family
MIKINFLKLISQVIPKKIGLVIGFSISVLSAEKIHTIRIENNNRIEKETILASVSLKKGDEAGQESVDQVLKELFNAGHFEDLKVSLKKGLLTIWVAENPMINQIQFEGNHKIKDDDIKQIVTFGPRSILSPYKVQAAQQQLAESYRRIGHYQARIHPKVIRLSENRVNLVFEIDEGNPSYVQSIRFIGNKSFSANQLEEQLSTKRYRWYRFWAVDEHYDPERFVSDQQDIQKFYNDRGFPDTRILSAVAELSPDQSSFYFTFTIEEGAQYTMGDTRIECSIPKIKTDSLYSDLQFKKGDLYSQKLIDRTIQQLKATLASFGYAFVEITPLVQKETQKKVVHLTFRIQSGPRVYVERIQIIGNDRTRDHVIRRDILLHEGDAYDAKKLEYSEQILKDLNYFKSVRLETTEGSAPDQALVQCKVEEQSTGELSGGLAYSTLDGPGVNVQVKENNLMGTGRIVYANASLSKNAQGVDLGLTDPRFLNRHLEGSVSVYGMRSSRWKSYRENEVGTTVGLKYPLSRYWAHKVFYTIQGSRISGLNQNGSSLLRNQARNSLKSLVGHMIYFSTVNSTLNPSSGFLWTAGNAWAGVGGNVSYLQHSTSATYYYPIHEEKEIVLKLFGEAGYLQKLNRVIRVVDSFPLGGETLRGFDYDGVGPRDLGSRDRECIRGTRFWRGTVELKFPFGFPQEWGIMGHTFSDFGTSWNPGETSTRVVDDKKVRMTAGLGISWRSPFGPIGVFWGRIIKKSSFDDSRPILVTFSTHF